LRRALVPVSNPARAARRGDSALDERTTRHEGYRVRQRKRKRIEECFGWLKTIALLRKVRHRGIFKVDWVFTFACAAYNLVRLRNLSVQGGVVQGRSVSAGSKIGFHSGHQRNEPSLTRSTTNGDRVHIESDVFQQPNFDFRWMR